MKKRLGLILSLTLLIVSLSSSLCFAAGGLELLDSSPKEGSKSSVINNVAIKLYFNEDVTSKEAQEANKDCFKITDPKGKEISYRLLYNHKKYPDQIWIQLEKDLVQKTEYKIVISGDLVSSDGDELGKNETVKFRTRDMSQDNNVYMILMVVMFGGMFFFSSWDMKRQAKKKEEELDAKVNPYKIAKEKGISYEEALVVAQKEKEKLEKKKRKQEEQEAAMRAALESDYDDDYYDEDVYHVARKRPISAVGGKPVPRAQKSETEQNEKKQPQQSGKKGQSKQQKKKKK